MPFPDLKSRRATPADNTHQTHSALTAPDTEAIWGEAAFSADAASRPKMTQCGSGRSFPMRGHYSSASMDHRAVNEILIEHSSVDTRRGALRHQYGDKVLLRVDPEARAKGAGPHGIALGARRPG